jgi:hypothetical protein
MTDETQVRTPPRKAVIDIESIAAVVHEAVRALCLEAGEGRVLPHWGELDGELKEQTICSVHDTLQNPDKTPEQEHERWMQAKLAAGWRYGPRRDNEHKLHPCLVEYESLSFIDRAKDTIVRDIALALSRA